MTSDAHLNESLINGMFNSRSRISINDASLTLSQQSRLDPRVLNSIKLNTNRLSMNSLSTPFTDPTPHPHPTDSILTLAKSQLQKFTQCMSTLAKRTQQIQDISKKSQLIKKKALNTKHLKRKATQNIDVLKQQIMVSRTNTSHKLKLQFDNLKSEYKKSQLQMRKLETENEKMKSIREGILDQELKFETEKKKMEVESERLEVELVMENLVLEVEKNLDIERVMNENRMLSTRIEVMSEEIEKGREEQESLIDKTRMLEEKLKISESSQIRSRSSSITASFEGSLQLGPSESQLSQIISNFTFYSSNIKNRLLNTASFYKNQDAHQRKIETEELKQLNQNLQIFTKVVEMVRKVSTGGYPHQVVIDISSIPNVYGNMRVSRNSSSTSNAPPNNSANNSGSKNKREREAGVAQNFSLSNVSKQCKILQNQNKNLKEVNKDLKQQLMKMIEDSATFAAIAASITHTSHTQTPPTSTPLPSHNNYQEKFKEIELKYKNARIGYQQLSSQLNESQLREKKIEFQLNKERSDRRKYHNEIEDIKGNIRVYCRVRPKKQGYNPQLQYKINPSTETLLLEAKNREFRFDAVYGESASQEEIFEDTKRLIQSAIEGYNVCIFAYGQTGSGKTYTLIGEPQRPGISIRSIEEIFHIKRDKKEYIKVDVSMSLFEIYLDSIKDLLGDRREMKSNIPESVLNNLNYVQNCTFIKVISAEQAINEYRKKVKERESSSTLMNDYSSRSHLVLTLILETENNLTNEKRISKFTIIDLAGSESFAKSGIKSQQAEECISINSSLSTLKVVMAGLTSKDQHSKYRDNKLVNILKDSIGGNSKTLMFVNISSEQSNSQETISSLDFANGVKRVDRSNVVIKKNILDDSRRSSRNSNKYY